MTDDLSPLLEEGVSAHRAFTVAPSHATTAFGDQDDPPGKPAAADATPEEATPVFGTPALLAWVEFVARESLHGKLPPGKGCAGESATVRHRRAVPVGAELTVETALAAVEGSRLTMEGTVRTPDGDVVGTVTADFRVVDRSAFRASLEGADSAGSRPP